MHTLSRSFIWLCAAIAFPAMAEAPDSLKTTIMSDNVSTGTPALALPDFSVSSDSLSTLPAALALPSRPLYTPRLPDIEPKKKQPWEDRFAIPDVGFVPGLAPLGAWQGGGVLAVGSRLSLPGLMGIESGSLSVVQSFGRLSLTGTMSATKYGYFRGLQTQWGVGGSATYRFSPQWSCTAFGNYYSRINAFNPAMAGYMSSSQFGGYFDWRISDFFGMMMGARAEQMMVTNRWQATPMVVPYVSIGGADIGVDVGGIVTGLIRSAIDSKQRKDRLFQFGGSVGAPNGPKPGGYGGYHGPPPIRRR